MNANIKAPFAKLVKIFFVNSCAATFGLGRFAVGFVNEATTARTKWTLFGRGRCTVKLSRWGIAKCKLTRKDFLSARIHKHDVSWVGSMLSACWKQLRGNFDTQNWVLGQDKSSKIVR
jgi:hypothetical protein